MKKIIPAISMLLLLLSSGLSAQTVTLDDIKNEYKQNPARATQKYMDKAYVTVTIKVLGVNNINFLGQPATSVSCGEYNNGDMQLMDIPYADIIKINADDSVTIKGVITGRGKNPGDFTQHVLLRKCQLVKITHPDDKFKAKLATQYACGDCTTDLKKYCEYAIDETLNSVRAEKKYLGQPLSFKMTVTEFNKPGITNYIKKGGVAGTVTDGAQKYNILIYGLTPDQIMKLNIGDAINIKGKLAITDKQTNRTSYYQSSYYKLITLTGCTLVP